MSKYGVIFGPYFPVFGMNTGYAPYIFSPNTGKYEPEITPYLHTYHAVYSVISRKNLLKVVNNTPTIKTLTQISAHWLILKTNLIEICVLKTFHFLIVSNSTTSILSDILITLWKSHEIIFVGYFWKITNT